MSFSKQRTVQSMSRHGGHGGNGVKAGHLTGVYEVRRGQRSQNGDNDATIC